ncbi:hypothetical protein [Sandaracinus amylolyticus]|uniref:Vgb family protein n=1 Tax=Sandaracinus amylolyticus TaxID=927083 RepID=UPI001F3D1E4A|nr:hypothetical protein [Sandaracinus amylolyticus]UJR86695.1 Hypothetical protein I5071_87960 [Sandaracinus amylolyticus]
MATRHRAAFAAALCVLPSSLALGACATNDSSSHAAALVRGDALYVGDPATNSVPYVDAETGEYLGLFVKRNSGGLHGPMGLVFARPSPAVRGDLLVANQHTDRPYAGEINEYDGRDGDFVDELVTRRDEGGPFAPRGIVVGPDGVLYVADVGGPSGRVATFDSTTGEHLGDLSTAGLTAELRPRGVVFGPDGELYVSNSPDLTGAGIRGQVLRFDPESGFEAVVVDCADATCDLHRPEGLVFGPDGRLYVTSFPDRANLDDVDRIVVYEIDGTLVDTIPLWAPRQLRASAQALIFGPEGCLFVGMSGFAFSGQVRRYDVTSGEFEVFVPAGGRIESAWYMTFGRTDPATLAYPGSSSTSDCELE